MARPVTVTISHDLGQEEARKRMREGFAKLSTQLSGGMMLKFTETWETEDRLSFVAKGLGQNITGEIDIFPQHVRITAVLPGVLAAIAETITGKVEKQGQILLEKK